MTLRVQETENAGPTVVVQPSASNVSSSIPPSAQSPSNPSPTPSVPNLADIDNRLAESVKIILETLTPLPIDEIAPRLYFVIVEIAGHIALPIYAKIGVSNMAHAKISQGECTCPNDEASAREDDFRGYG